MSGADSTIPKVEHSVNVATGRSSRLMVVAVLAGVLACVPTWLAGEAAIRSIETEADGTNVNGEVKDIITVLSSNRSDVKRASYAYGLQGAILGLVLGLAGGVVRKSVTASLLAAIAGATLGVLAGAGGSHAIFPVFFQKLDPISSDLLLPLITHVGFWSILGASSGLAFGLGLGGTRNILRATIGGLIGAAFGVFLYEFAGAFFFPGAKTDQPFASEASARFLAQALTGVFTAAGAAAAVTTTSPPIPRNLAT